jgi:hypothetical protein
MKIQKALILTGASGEIGVAIAKKYFESGYFDNDACAPHLFRLLYKR